MSEGNIDEHPLRYSPITCVIEPILFSRALNKRLDGYTLETALEIASALSPSEPTEGRDDLIRRCITTTASWFSEEISEERIVKLSQQIRAENPILPKDGTP